MFSTADFSFLLLYVLCDSIVRERKRSWMFVFLSMPRHHTEINELPGLLCFMLPPWLTRTGRPAAGGVGGLSATHNKRYTMAEYRSVPWRKICKAICWAF
jgi:hypothetical protein